MANVQSINSAGLSIVKTFEGLSLTPYLCPAGWWTIGFGHLVKEDTPKVVTQEEAESYLERDIHGAELAVLRLVRPLSENQFSALVSFTFNLGSGALQRSTLRAMVNREEYDDAAEQFGLWVYGGGRKLPGLIRRRAAEELLFRS